MTNRQGNRPSGNEWPVRWRDLKQEAIRGDDEAMASRLFSAASTAQSAPSKVADPTHHWTRFVRRRSQTKRRGSLVRRVTAAALAGGVAVLLWALLVPKAPTPSSVAPTSTVRQSVEVLLLDRPGDRVSFVPEPGRRVALTEGTRGLGDFGGSARILLQGEAEMDVLSSRTGAVALALARGEALAYVRPGAYRSFTVRVGEVEVKVTGTVFGVTVSAGRAEVAVWRGAVALASPAGTFQVKAGERVEVTLPEGRLLRRDVPRSLTRDERLQLEQTGALEVGTDHAAKPQLATRSGEPNAPSRAVVAKLLPEVQAEAREVTEKWTVPVPDAPPEKVREAHRAPVLAPKHGGAQAAPDVGERVARRSPSSGADQPMDSVATEYREHASANGRKTSRTQLEEPPQPVEQEAETPTAAAEESSGPGGMAAAKRDESQMTAGEREAQFLELSRGSGESAANALFSLGAFRLERLHDRRGAIEAWLEYVRRFPHGGLAGEAHAGLFQALAAEGEFARAAEHGEDGLEKLGSSLRSERLRLDVAELLLGFPGHTERARYHLQKLTLVPGPIGERATFLLAGALARLGDQIGARRTVSEYLERYPEGRYRAQAMQALEPIPPTTAEDPE